MEAHFPEPRFTYELPEGQTVGPGVPLDPQLVSYWLELANNEAASHLQRVAAVILLFQMGAHVKVVVSGS